MSGPHLLLGLERILLLLLGREELLALGHFGQALGLAGCLLLRFLSAGKDLATVEAEAVTVAVAVVVAVECVVHEHECKCKSECECH